MRSFQWSVAAACALLAPAPGASAETWTYTLDADFDRGELHDVNHDVVHDQLQVNERPAPYPFLWVAASERGTVLKIDVRDGRIRGEYLSAPDGMGRDPSRTSVDRRGDAWVGNRAEMSPSGLVGADGRPFVREDGSVLKLGLLEAGGCVDRNGNGVIDTSTGHGDVKPWTNAGDADSRGGVATAADECIVLYVRVDPPLVRQIAVDLENDVWVGGDSNQGLPEKKLQHLDGRTGAVRRTVDLNSAADTGLPPLYPGHYGAGYGGFVDCHGHVWSAGSGSERTLRLDPSLPNGAPGFARFLDLGANSYGIGLAPNGHVWQTTWRGNSLLEIDDDLNVIGGPYPTSPSFPGNPRGARGVAVSPFDSSVWVANSGYDTITRHSPDGVVRAIIAVDAIPTGVAVDGEGKVWVTCLEGDSVLRIDPATNRVDLRIPLELPGHPIAERGGPYNYSDMTGIIALDARPYGRWTVATDAGCAGFEWTLVDWNGTEPAGTRLEVEARAAEDAARLAAQPWLAVTRGVPLPPLRGRLLETRVGFRTAPGTACRPHESPVLLDLAVTGFDRVAPRIECPADATVACDAPLPSDRPSASDDCGAVTPVMSERRDPGPCPASFTLVRIWSVTDRSGNTSSCVQRVVVEDETPPRLVGVPADATYDCEAPPAPEVTAVDGCSEVRVDFTEAREDGPCPSSYDLRRTWVATDQCGNTTSAAQLVRVRDAAPPEIRVIAAPGCLWPPNHSYVCFTDLGSLVEASDACPGEVRVAVAGCRSDQPDDQQGSEDRGINGDGNTEHDCVVAADGSGFCARSERLGQCKAGRTYGVVVRATDACGNSAEARLGLHVPHDQREHPDCLPERPHDFVHRNEPLPFAVVFDPAPDAGLPHPFECP